MRLSCSDRGFVHTYLLAAILVLLIISTTRSQEQSVNPGINEAYQNPDVAQFVERFEGEGREVYEQRERIVDAAGIRPGQTVADIGAGTGLFTRLFAQRVGPKGHVYAVDIAKNFVEHIERTSEELGLENVTGVVCQPDGATLLADSIDVAFICDTYHHFEFPHKTMASIHEALKTGGRLIVIDFHRIEGVSSEWVLNHVRAGQETFVGEIEDAGFKLIAEKDFLEDNYFLVFEKAQRPTAGQPQPSARRKRVAVAAGVAPHPLAAPGVTSLTNDNVRYRVPDAHAVRLERQGIVAVIVDNTEVDGELLTAHRAGYNGVGALGHARRRENLFVPNVAGLNFEHIHDGTLAVEREKFEPRRNPMELRIVDQHTVELYQPPTRNWQLESCGRYHLLPDGTIEYTFECIPRADSFSQGYLGLFWASYIHEPEDKAIYFLGRRRGTNEAAAWIKAISPAHGVRSTHPPTDAAFVPEIHPQFPLTLVNHPSEYEYVEPWYYGISHGLAYVQMFRKRDQIWLAQSPTGGGSNNPAWDFQWFIPDYQVGEAYGFVMRAAYLPYESPAQLERATRDHRAALNATTERIEAGQVERTDE